MFLSHKVMAAGATESPLQQWGEPKAMKKPVLQGPVGVLEVSGGEHKKNHAPNNNTPVKTGVLWGCIEGVWDDLKGYGQVVLV